MPTTVSGVSERLVGVLLTVTVVLSFVLPGLLGAATPQALVRLHFGPHDAALTAVLGTTASFVGLFAGAAATDRWGVRPVLLGALTLLLGAGVLLAAAFDHRSYLLGAVLVDAAVLAVLAAGLASVPERHLPGRITGVVGAALAAIGLSLFVEANLVDRLLRLLGWRGLLALVPCTAAVLLVLVALLVKAPKSAALPPLGRASSRASGETGTGWGWNLCGAVAVLALTLLALALQLAPLWGWADPAVPALLGAGLAAGLIAVLGARRRGRGILPTGVPRRVAYAAVTAALAFGVTNVTLGLAAPPLALERGVARWQAALILSCFGLGMTVAALLARRYSYSRVAGSSLGLLVAVVAMSLLHVLPGGAVAATWEGCLLLAMTGFGLMAAQVPHIAEFLTVLPRHGRAVAAVIYPAALLLGALAAQCLPYATRHPYGEAARAGADLTGAHVLLQIAVLVVAVAAIVLGRPAVALALLLAGGAQYLLIRWLAGSDQARQPEAVAVAMAVGAAAGLAVWTRTQQSERLARSSAAAATLQDAVLHQVPHSLGGLNLAGLYQPATVDTGIGGDFFEVLDTVFGVRVLLGDVRGKGVQAVQTVTDLLGGFRSQAHETPELGELVARLDRQLARAATARADDELFATALVLQYHAPGSRFELIDCGHLPPFAVTRGRVRELELPTGLPLGFGGLGLGGAGLDVDRPAVVVTLEPGATLLLHTDGLSEARNASGEFYPLAQRLAAAPAVTPEALVDHLGADIHDWTHHRADDIAVLALRPDTPDRLDTPHRPDAPDTP